MFLSFYMSTFNCVTTERIPYFQNYLNQYLPHPAAATFNGKAILSTFGGEWCTWGQGSGVTAVNSGWGIVMGSRRASTYYMPAYTMGDGPSKWHTPRETITRQLTPARHFRKPESIRYRRRDQRECKVYLGDEEQLD